LVLSFFMIVFLVPETSKAVDLQEISTSEDSVITKVWEGLEYFFAFRVQNKVQVLEKHAEKRLIMAREYAEEGDDDGVQNSMQNYLQVKERQTGLLGRVDGDVLGAVSDRTIDQQKTMEEIKMRIDEDGKEGIIQVQERVVNQVAQRIIETNGAEGQTEFFQKVEHVWAPGTGPGGGERGVIIEGGAMQFAPGTSAGGPAGSDIKTVEIKTGDGSNDGASVNDGGSNSAPATIQGETGGNTIDPGGLAPGTY